MKKIATIRIEDTVESKDALEAMLPSAVDVVDYHRTLEDKILGMVTVVLGGAGLPQLCMILGGSQTIAKAYFEKGKLEVGFSA